MIYSVIKKIKGNFMKNSIIFIFCTASIFLLTACGEETKENIKKGIENPVDNYMDSRVNAMDMAKQSVKENNKEVSKQNKAIDNLTK
jgi:hypothetical protein